MSRYTLSNVTQRYRESRTGRIVDALRVPHLDITSGEVVAVVGHNGSGKSTLLELLAFLKPPDVGRILLDGEDIWRDGSPLSARRRCPLLLQRSVLFKTTVLRNVMYGLRARGMSRATARQRAKDALRMVRLDHLAHRGHRELSGGERQRVALARALVLNPEVLLLDEPTAHVDHENEHLIEEMIRQLHGRREMTVVLASHDSRQALSLADRVVTLVDGELLLGPMDNLFVGTLRRNDQALDGNQLVFRGDGNLRLSFAEEAVAADPMQDLTEHLSSETKPVRIAIDAGRVSVELLPHESSDQGSRKALAGRIESVRQYGDRCRLRVLLDDKHRLRAELPMATFLEQSLNLGACVAVRFAKEAVRVLRLGRSDLQSEHY